MNDKVMNVFNKNNDQLEKELARRGLPYTIYTPCYNKKIISRERAIAEIIYKDAYDCGRGNPIDTTCPANCRGVAKPETAEYELLDLCENTRYRIELTEDQVRLMHWLDNKAMLCEHEFTEWGEMFVDVGEI
jgi:hypothetical protein